MARMITCKKCGCVRKNQARGVCKRCYVPPAVICKICRESKPHQAFGLCKNCYQKNVKYDVIQRYKAKKLYNITLEQWKKATRVCVICGFDKVIDLHHIDKDHKNNSPENLTGLCPNHHHMIHNSKYKEEIEGILRKKIGQR